MKKSEYKKHFLYVMFGIYIVVVLWLTLMKRRTGYSRATLTPFWEYRMVINNYQRTYFIRQIVGNIALFIPLGILLPFMPKFKNVKLGKVMLIGLCLSVVIELTQYVTGRGLMEFDDVFNNTLGAVIGYGVYRIVNMMINKYSHKT